MQKKTYSRTLIFFLGAIIASFWGVLGVFGGTLAYSLPSTVLYGHIDSTWFNILQVNNTYAFNLYQFGGYSYYMELRNNAGTILFSGNANITENIPSSISTYPTSLTWDSNYWQNSPAGVYSIYLWDSVLPNGHDCSLYSDNCVKIGLIHLTLNSDKTFSLESSAVNGVCGLDTNQTIDHAPPTVPYTLCQAGTASSITNIPYQGWVWSCYGSNGGSTDTCQAYASTSASFAPSCGTAAGTNFTEGMPTGSSACSIGTLSTPSGQNTDGSYYWDCDLDPYNPVHCSTNAIYTVPTVTLDDCSGMTGIEYYGCTIWNGIQVMFVPSQEKLQEFQEVQNLMGGVFPFNYISAAATAIGSIHIATSDNLTITVNGTPYTLSAASLTGMPLVADVKLFATWIVILLFLGWAINYIKHFFK